MGRNIKDIIMRMDEKYKVGEYIDIKIGCIVTWVGEDDMEVKMPDGEISWLCRGDFEEIE